MINLLIKAIKENKSVSRYLINEIKKESYELFFVHDKVETVRSTESISYNVNIYVSYDYVLGNVSFSAYLSDTYDELVQKVQNAVNRALSIANKPYNLEQKEVYVKNVESNISLDSFSKIATKIGECFLNTKLDEYASLNATECFIYKTTFRTLNSLGLDKTSTSYNVMIETIPTYTKEKESVEIYQAYNLANIDFEVLKEKVLSALNDVKARYYAKKMDKYQTSTILLRPQELSELAYSFVDNLSFRAKYANLNIFNIGDEVQKLSKSDLLNIELTNKLDGKETDFFDDFGTNLQAALIIKDGVVNALHGDAQFAQYLNEKPTGKLSNLYIKAGSKSIKELKSAPYLECASMSGIQIALDKDYIGGEVRLGYYFDGKETIPVTGLYISGKLSDVLNNMYLSKETITEEDYSVPKYALFKGFTIL